MDRLYAVIEKELNISQEVFNRIIADEGACEDICECLFYCLDNKEMGWFAAAVLQYILDNKKHEDGGPGSGNFGHEGRPGEVGGSAPSGASAMPKMKGVKSTATPEQRKAATEKLESLRTSMFAAKARFEAYRKEHKPGKPDYDPKLYNEYEAARNRAQDETKSLLDDLPVGTLVVRGTVIYQKLDDGEWSMNDPTNPRDIKLDSSYVARHLATDNPENVPDSLKVRFIESADEITQVRDFSTASPETYASYAEALNNGERKDIVKRAKKDPEFKELVDGIVLYTEGGYAMQRQVAEKLAESGLSGVSADSVGEYVNGNLYRFRSLWKDQLETSESTIVGGMIALNGAINESDPTSIQLFRVAQDRQILFTNGTDPYVPPSVGDKIKMTAPTSFTASREVEQEIGKQKMGDTIHYVLEPGAKAVNVAALSKYKQEEYLSCGEYEVVSVTTKKQACPISGEPTQAQIKRGVRESEYGLKYCDAYDVTVVIRQTGTVSYGSRDDEDVEYLDCSGHFDDRMVIDGGPGSGNHNHQGRPGERGGSAPGNGSRTVVHGKDISKSYTGDKSTKAVIEHQGFGGLPKIVKKKEFDAAVKASKFVAQRTYSASSQEILDTYRDQLYNGDFYVDCTIGGAQYGQGMYTVADYNGEITEGMQQEIEHYKSLYKTTMTDSEAKKTATEKALARFKHQEREKLNPELRKYVDGYDFAQGMWNPDFRDEAKALKDSNPELYGKISGYLKSRESVFDEEVQSIKFGDRFELGQKYGFQVTSEDPSFTETITLDPSAKICTHDEIREKSSDWAAECKRGYIEAHVGDLDLGDQEAAYIVHRFGGIGEESSPFKGISREESIAWYRELGQEEKRKISEIKGLQELVGKARQAEEDFLRLDDGAKAALRGYDAINAEGHGLSGSYTVILNRTKVIFLDPDDRTDRADADMITFQPYDDGLIYAIRDGKVIGYVKVSAPEKERKDGGPGSGNHGHKGVPGQVGGSAPSEGGIKSASSASGKRSVGSLMSKASRSPEYQKADTKRKAAAEKIIALEKELRDIPSKLPRSKWTDDQKELVDLLGEAYAPSNPEWYEKYKERDAALDELQNANKELNGILLKEEPPVHLRDLGSPRSATTDEFVGFKASDTGTSLNKDGSRIVEMSPEEYLKRCAGMFNDVDGRKTNLTMQVRGLDRETIDKLKDLIRSGEKLDTPWLDERGINGQEGRHRAAAAYELGIEKIPVVYWDGFGRNHDDREDGADTHNSAAVLVIKDGKILTGTRLSKNGNGQICGPGGHVQDDESVATAAIRETEEEFGIVLNELVFLDRGPVDDYTGNRPYIFLSTDYDGEPKCDEEEMSGAKFLSIEEIIHGDYDLFDPFRESLLILLKKLTGKSIDTSNDDGTMNQQTSLDADENGDWITVKGTHVFVGEKGSVQKGPAPLKSKKFGEAKSQKSSSGKESSRTGAGSSSAPKATHVHLVTPPSKKFKSDFMAARETQPEDKRWRVSADYEEGDYDHMSRFQTSGGSTFAIHDGDIVSVCKHAGDSIRGKQLMAEAVAKGGNKLDSFSGNHGFYVRCGFEPVSWCAFDEQYAPDGWDKNRDKKEPVIFYKYTGNTDGSTNVDDFLKSVPASADYDSAKKARDDSM